MNLVRKIVAVIAVTAAPALLAQNNGSAKIAPDTPRSGNVDVIVQYVNNPDSGQHQKMTGMGGVLKRELHSIKSDAYIVSSDVLADIAADPAVVSITPDRGVHGLMEFANPTVNA